VDPEAVATGVTIARDILSGGIVSFFEWLAEAVSWLNDDHLADGILVLEGEQLQERTPREFETCEGLTGWDLGRCLAYVPWPHGRVHLRGDQSYYTLRWDLLNDDYPHVRLVLSDLYCIDCDCDDWSDEPYVLDVGFSIFPGGAVTWVPEPIPGNGDDVDSGEEDEDFPEIVVFDGEVSEDYTIGFVVSLFEDDGGTTSRGSRRGMAEDIAEQLQARLTGSTEAGECGEAPTYRLQEFEVDEDCGGGGVFRFGAYNVGEPGHLWFADLGPFGFPGEPVAGVPCQGEYKFCGSLACGDCGRPVLDFLREDAWTYAFDDLATR